MVHQRKTIRAMFIVLLFCLFALADCGTTEETKFKVMMSITFESDLSKIPDYPKGTPYSEPVGVGVLEMDVTFPKSGGSAASQTGEIRLTDYHEKGPNCTLEIPDDMIGTKSPVSWSDIVWDPAGRMTFEAEIHFENPSFSIIANCPPYSAPVEEYPLYKLLGIFNEKMKSFSVEISPDGSYFKDLHWGMHDTIQVDLDVVIQKVD